MPAKAEDVESWTGIISTPELDDAGDRVLAGSWRWMGATVPLLVRHAGPPVGTVRPYRDGDRLMGEVRFLRLGTSPAVDAARGSFAAGRRALSPRFLARGTRNGQGGLDISAALLREVSLVTSGAHSEARIIAQTPTALALPSDRRSDMNTRRLLVLPKCAPSTEPAPDAPRTFREALARQNEAKARDERRSLLDLFGTSAVSILEHGGPDAERLLRRSADEFIAAALDATTRGEKINRRGPLFTTKAAGR